MVRIGKTALGVIALVLASGGTSPKQQCATDPQIASAARAWAARIQQPPLTVAWADAPCFRNALLARLTPTLGPIVGYKVGVWTKAAQVTNGASGPVVGVLHKGMMLPEDKPVPVSFAFSPMAEADFLVIVGDEGINMASTREEAYRHLRGYRPFIELPDNHYPPETKADIARLVALNVNARAGIMGKEIPLRQTPEGFAGLAGLSVSVTLRTPAGVQLSSGKSAETLGDPLDIVLTTRDLLRDEGITLKRGDVISLGTLTPPHQPVAGETMSVRYSLGDQTSDIEASFKP